MNQISPLAYIHPEAKLGDNNVIGPFCYIDKDTVIGDNNVMQNSVTINTGARIGNGNEIFPGASISTKPQDLKFKGEITTCEIGDNNSIRENVTISRGTASKGCTSPTTVSSATDASSATPQNLPEKWLSMISPSSVQQCSATSSATSAAM